MVTATKNSIDISFKSTNTNLSSKSTSELYKADNSKTTSKLKSKSEDFKDVLSSKTNSKDEDTQKVDELIKMKLQLKLKILLKLMN